MKIVNQAKYLRITRDENLTFEMHVDSLKIKLFRQTCILANLRHYIKQDFFRTFAFLDLYFDLNFAFIDLYFRYGSQIWGRTQCLLLKI